MKSFLKSLGLAILILLVFVLIYNLFNKPSNVANQKVNANESAQKYWEYVEKQNKAYMDQLAMSKEQILISKEINENSLKNQERYEKLLERWEQQAERIDQILSKLETKK